MSLNRRLLLFAVFSIVMVNAVLMALPWTPKRPLGTPEQTSAQPAYWRLTTLHRTAGVLSFFMMRGNDDSWGAMFEAHRALHENPGVSLYGDVFFEKGVKFQYPPTSLLVIEPVARATPSTAMRLAALNAVSYVALWLNAVLVGMIFVRSCDVHLFDDLNDPRSRRLRFLLAVAMTLTFYPIVRAAWLGQIQTWLNAGFALVIYLWMLGGQRRAGVLTSLLCAIKPQHGLLLAWAGALRRWGFVGAMIVTGGAVALVSAAAYGLKNHLDYLSVLSYISKHGEGFFPNQSVNGLLNRLVHNGNNNDWDSFSFAPYNTFVYHGTLLSSIAFIAGACIPWHRLLSRGRRVTEGWSVSTCSLLIAILSFTMASPIAWEHHYGILMPIFAWMLPALIRSPIFGRWTIPLLGAAYVLASNFFGATRALADTPFNFLQSYLFFAALVVLVMLYRLRGVEARRC